MKKQIPRVMCDFSQLLPVVEPVIGRQVNGEVRSWKGGQKGRRASHRQAPLLPPSNLLVSHHINNRC